MLSQRKNILSELQRQEINIFPLQPKSKIPLDSWKQYQTEVFNGAIPDECNFAVVCGDISDDLVVFDFDRCLDIDIVKGVFGEDILSKTLVVKTNRGYHVYIKTNHLPKNLKLEKDGLLIDVQSTGKYVVGPTSIHPNGTEYEMVSITPNIMLIDCKDHIQKMLDKGFTIHGSTEQNTTADIAKGGVKNGHLHNSFLKYCNHLLFTVGINDWHTYTVETDRWNQPGNNEYQINLQDFERVRKDAWNHFHRKKEDKNEGKPEERSEDEYADDIMIQYNFKTLRETEELLVYKNGVYVYDPECSVIKEECEKILDNCNTRFCNEIINKIKRRTFVNRSEFDSDIDVLNLKNGLYNIKTGKWSDHDPNYLSRIQLPVEYKPEAVPYSFLKYISECLPRPEDLFVVMEGFASCLLKTSKYEKAFMFIGGGSNGKSTFLEIMMEVLGRDNISNVSIHDLTQQRFTKAELEGKLANIYADVESDELRSTGVLKALISGDSILVEKKNQHPFKMRNIAKMFFSANRFPEVLDQSNAMFRRFVIVDWIITFDKKKDINLKSRLLNDPNELSGILNILIKLARDLEKRGSFKFNVDIEKLRKNWNEKADPIRKFIDDNIVLGENYEVERVQLYEAYVKFCTGQNIVIENRNVFYVRIKDLTHMEDDNRRIGNDIIRVLKGGVLRSGLRKDKQRELE